MVCCPESKRWLLLLPIGNPCAGNVPVAHQPVTDRNTPVGKYLFSQTVPQILLLASESHSIRLSYIRMALLSCFCKTTGHTG